MALTFLVVSVGVASSVACPLSKSTVARELSTSDHEDLDLFCGFVADFNREYASIEETRAKFGIFQSNVQIAKALQREADAANHSVVYGVTKFSDWTPEEFHNWVTYRGPGYPSTPDYPMTYVRQPPAGSTPPDSFDWRTKGVLTKVRDQGACGDCWAFSATEEVESMAAIAGLPLQELSVQELTSCDRKTNWHCPDDDDCRNVDAGCNGGDPVFGSLYICNVTHGLSSEADYPFKSGKSGKTESCEKPSTPPVKMGCTGFSWAVPPCDKGQCANQNETLLMANLAAYGPAAISVDAAGNGWQNYKSGIMPNMHCKGAGVAKLDHAVQLVGYGSEAGEKYWVVRNSWNTDWGEDGFIRFHVGDNACGLADQPFFVDF